MGFAQILPTYSRERIETAILSRTSAHVAEALGNEPRSFHDFLALLSPAAEEFLEEMAQSARQYTIQRFGRVVCMYAPLYLSSECTNACVYCGFSRTNQIERATLSVKEVLEEADILYRQGFRHILLVSGESHHHVDLPYLLRTAQKLHSRFASISIELYPMGIQAYRKLIACGVDGLTIYQETYDPHRYGEVHPSGPKRNYRWRLESPDRGGEAGFRRLNIGALLGLSPWRTEGAFLGLHAVYLLRTYWRSQISLSFPRLRPAAGGYAPPYPVTDAQMVQLMCALRLWLPDVGLVVSTREPPEFRDHLISLGVTHMSAGSRTAPGGYSKRMRAEGQFEIDDRRDPGQVARAIASQGYEPVWKDWDAAFLGHSS